MDHFDYNTPYIRHVDPPVYSFRREENQTLDVTQLASSITVDDWADLLDRALVKPNQGKQERQYLHLNSSGKILLSHKKGVLGYREMDAGLILRISEQFERSQTLNRVKIGEALHILAELQVKQFQASNRQGTHLPR